MANQVQTDFPLPENIEGFWLWDKLHCPRPLAPMEQELLLQTCIDGFNRSMSEMNAIIDVALRFENYYPYLGMPLKEMSEAERAEALEETRRRADELTPRIGHLWDNEWLPAMLPALDRAQSLDVANLDDEALVAELEQMGRDVTDRWAVHGKLNYSFFAAGQFADFYNEHVQPEDPSEAYELLQGHENIALDSSRLLWKMSREVLANQELRTLFEQSEPDEIAAQLDQSEAGRGFKQELDDYLERFGWRADGVYELRTPAWREDPGIAISAVQGYLSLGDEASPDAGLEGSIQRREELLAKARERLSSNPEARERFEHLYQTASAFTRVVEDHNHYIDQMGDIALRYPALEIGRRLTERGRLEQPEDIFMLYLAEVEEAMLQDADQSALAARRRQELDHWSQVVPPPTLGVPGAPTGDPVEDLLMRFFGTPVEPSADPTVITGIGASPGTQRGTAKVVRDLAEASKVQPGDVMVCEMTLPPWTPLFSTISAVVADTGGLLSHCAIVAREYRIPCVVGTAVGTTMIQDGQEVTVDGSKGLVRIESR